MTFVAHLITNGIVSKIHAISKKTTTSQANGQDPDQGCPQRGYPSGQKHIKCVQSLDIGEVHVKTTKNTSIHLAEWLK